MFKVSEEILQTNREMLSDFYEMLVEWGKSTSAEKVRKQIELLDNEFLNIQH